MLPYSATIMVCFVLCLMTGLSFGDTVEITLTSNPQEVQTLITKELQLQCNISPVQTRSSQVTDVSYIESIEITDQDGDKVVSVQRGQREPFIKSKGFGDKGAEATASVGLPTGYLNLHVPNPDKSTTCDSTTCKFTCKGTVYTTTSSIPAIIQDETTVTWAETPINELVKIVYNDVVRSPPVRIEQITQGHAGCTPPKVYKLHYVNVNFGRTYAKPPRVFLSRQYTRGALSGGVAGHNNNEIFASQITTTGFRLRSFANNKLSYLIVNWIAFPSA